MATRSPSPTVAHLRGKVAALSRSRTDNDPELRDARRALAAESLAERASRIAAAAPPLTEAQRDRIAAILGGGAAA